MKYYIWLDANGRPVSKAWRYEDEVERIAEKHHRPPSGWVILQSGTKQQLKKSLGLRDEDFVGGWWEFGGQRLGKGSFNLEKGT